MLCRHVQVVADLRQVADRRDQVVGHVSRVVGDKLDPVETLDGVEHAEKVGQPGRAAAVGPLVAVDGLADERDLAAALGDELPRLGHDRLGGAGLLGAANMRHHAERAELIAAGLRADEGLEGRGPHGRVAVGIVALEAPRNGVAAARLAIEADLDSRAAAGEHLVYECGHLVELPRADDKVDPRRPLADQVLVFLCHAPEHAHDHVGPLRLHAPDAAKRGVDLVFGVLPHAAGVVEDGIGLAAAGGQLPALAAERGHHELAVEHVHLAADGFDPEPFRHAC